jgi:LuxR family maltose regulon positive regulatory protein
MMTYQNVLPSLEDYSTYNAPVAYLGLARIFYEWNDLDAAEQYGEKSLQLARQYDQVIDRLILSELFLARLKLARRDVSGAMSKILLAEQISNLKNYSFRLPDIAYAKTGIHLFQGNVKEAARLVQQNDIPLMQARVLISQNIPYEALALVETQRQRAEENRLVGRLLQVKAVQSVVLFAQGEKDKAVQVLAEALEMAEPGGYIRLFLDEGDLMDQLLLESASRGILPNYVARLLAAFEAEKRTSKDKTDPYTHQLLIEPLSLREMEILKLISLGLSNEEIGKKLFLALDTVKGHNRRIFEKLQVHRRIEAIARARELNLF